MRNKESQAETKVDSEQMPIAGSSAQMPQNPMLASVLNWLGFVEMVLFAVLLVTTVWMDSNIVRKLLSSDLIAFFATLIIYWLCCYKSKSSH